VAAIVASAGPIWNTRVAAASGARGCVSQVDLRLRGNLHIDRTFAAAAGAAAEVWSSVGRTMTGSP
jgi:hypothetical protein